MNKIKTDQNLIWINFNVKYENDSSFNNAMDGKKEVQNRALTNFVHLLIRQNAKHNNDSYSLFASDLDHIDKKLFLSHLVSADEYEDYLENETRMNAAIKDYEEDMQFFINENIDDVYHEDMRDFRFHSNSEW